MNKKDYWDPMYEDSLNLLAKLPEIATYIYVTYQEMVSDSIQLLANPDFGANLHL
ncbi:MAG: hypothetical protein R2764_16090 [Bacteroidales bacterium]